MSMAGVGGGGGDIAGVSGSFGVSSTKGSRSGTSLTSLFSPEDLELLRSLIGGQANSLEGKTNKFSKEAALADSEGLVQGIARQLSEQILPGIVNQESAGGQYASTSKGFLANDAIARASEAATALQLQTVKDYATIEQLQFAPLFELFGLLKGGQQNTTFNEKSKSKTKEGKLGFNFGF